MNKLHFRRNSPMGAVLTAIAIVAVLGFGFAGTTHAQSIPLPSGDLSISPDILPDGTVGVPYSQMLTASTTASGTFTWRLSGGSLPSGLSINSSSNTMMNGMSTFLISGTPTMVGQGFTFSVSATNNSIAATQTYVMNINANPNPSAATAVVAPIMVVTSSTSTITTTTSNIESEISVLTQEVLQLESELPNSSAMVTTGTGMVSCGSATFCRTLTVGDSGADVVALQRFLNQNGYPVAVSGPGSAGNETDYFGTLTQAALGEWQAANGITSTQGYFDPTTELDIMTKMNAN